MTERTAPLVSCKSRMPKVFFPSSANIQPYSPALKKRRNAGTSFLDDEADPQEVQDVHHKKLHESLDASWHQRLKGFSYNIVAKAKPTRFENINVSQTDMGIDGEALRGGMLRKVVFVSNVCSLS